MLFLDRTFYCTFVSTFDIPRCFKGLYTRLDSTFTSDAPEVPGKYPFLSQADDYFTIFSISLCFSSNFLFNYSTA